MSDHQDLAAVAELMSGHGYAPLSDREAVTLAAVTTGSRLAEVDSAELAALAEPDVRAAFAWGAAAALATRSTSTAPSRLRRMPAWMSRRKTKQIPIKETPVIVPVPETLTAEQQIRAVAIRAAASLPLPPEPAGLSTPAAPAAFMVQDVLSAAARFAIYIETGSRDAEPDPWAAADEVWARHYPSDGSEPLTPAGEPAAAADGQVQD